MGLDGLHYPGEQTVTKLFFPLKMVEKYGGVPIHLKLD